RASTGVRARAAAAGSGAESAVAATAGGCEFLRGAGCLATAIAHRIGRTGRRHHQGGGPYGGQPGGHAGADLKSPAHPLAADGEGSCPDLAGAHAGLDHGRSAPAADCRPLPPGSGHHGRFVDDPGRLGGASVGGCAGVPRDHPGSSYRQHRGVNMWLLVSMVMTAVSLCMAAWWLGTPFVRVGLTGGHARPILLIVLWPWVLAVTPLCNRCMSWHWRRRIQQLLEQADAGHYGTPRPFLAWQCVLCLISASGVALLLAGRGGPGMTALVCLAAGALAALWPVRLLRERIRRRRTDMLRAFPFLLDMVTLCVEAGLNLQGAMKQAAEKGPQGPLREEVRHLLADIRA